MGSGQRGKLGQPSKILPTVLVVGTNTVVEEGVMIIILILILMLIIILIIIILIIIIIIIILIFIITIRKKNGYERGRVEYLKKTLEPGGKVTSKPRYGLEARIEPRPH